MKPIINVKEIVDQDSNPTLVWEAIAAQGVGARVSDIHVMAQQDGYELAYRLDGDLHSQGVLPRDFSRRLISHVKTMAEIDLGENRRPTEGRMHMQVAGKTLEMRVSVVPTIHGQDLVVRLFDHTVSLFKLHELGMLEDQLGSLRDTIDRPNGLILVSGPSGSGKTTTLYAILRDLVDQPRKIMTIENPVEYDLEGISQSQVNPKIGVTFALVLRAILRQDPDVIMVGEIRDEETARTAVRAANTGHLVLATTHAPRASRAVETLLSLGVHPYFLATALRGAIAQVLLKKICPDCKKPLPETGEVSLSKAVRSRLGEDESPQLWQGTGCDACFGTGYRGRLGLFELFLPDDATRQLIAESKPARQIDEAAAESGHLSLDDAGYLAAVRGLTTIEEVVDVLPDTLSSTA